LPSHSPHDHMILRVDLVDSHGRWKRPCLQTNPDAARWCPIETRPAILHSARQSTDLVSVNPPLTPLFASDQAVAVGPLPKSWFLKEAFAGGTEPLRVRHSAEWEHWDHQAAFTAGPLRTSVFLGAPAPPTRSLKAGAFPPPCEPTRPLSLSLTH
jgi:hypothetical protein